MHLAKRSQSEIVGLLIIVMMISFILIFAIVMMMNRDDPSSAKNENLISSLAGSIISTDSNCTANTDIKLLLMDCGKWHRTGGSTSIKCTNGQNSCDFAFDKIEFMLENTLQKWKVPYEFVITAPGQPGEVPSPIKRWTYGEINTGRSGEYQDYPLPIRGHGSMKIILCTGGCGSLFENPNINE